MHRYNLLILCTILGLGFSASKAMAENSVQSVGSQVTAYKIPKNSTDTVLSWFGRNEEQYMYETSDKLLLSDFQENKKDDGSTDLTLKVYNKFVMDGFVEIYDKDGRISDIKVIEGKSAPESLVGSGVEMFTEVPVNLYQYNWADPRSLGKETEIKINLKTGQRADFSTSTPRVLVYNMVFALLSAGDFLSDFKKSPETKKLVAEFIKELESKGKLDLFVLALAEGRPVEELLRSQTCLDLISLFGTYVKDQGISAGTSVAVERLSDGIEGLVAKLGPVGAATSGASKFVFEASKVSNLALRAQQAITRFSSKPSPFSLAVPALNDNKQKQEISQINRSNFDRINQAMQDYSSCVTQYGASHIGSANCFIARSPSQYSAYEQQRNTDNIQPGSLQERNQYTDGQIVRAPLDIGLEWNQNTKLDLDSHLVAPNGEHVYFSQRGKLNEAPNAFLYRDSIPNGGLKGAEQTRITKFQEGQYRFYVYNYSDSTGQEAARITGPNGLSNAAATVKLYEGGAPLTNVPNDPAVFDLNNPNVQKVGNPYPGDSTFNVPTNQPGNTWYVFRLDTRTGILTRVDRLGNSPDSSGVPNVRY